MVFCYITLYHLLESHCIFINKKKKSQTLHFIFKINVTLNPLTTE